MFFLRGQFSTFAISPKNKTTIHFFPLLVWSYYSREDPKVPSDDIALTRYRRLHVSVLYFGQRESPSRHVSIVEKR